MNEGSNAAWVILDNATQLWIFFILRGMVVDTRGRFCEKKSWKDNCDAKNLGRQNAKNFPITVTIQYHFSAATYKANRLSSLETRKIRSISSECVDRGTWSEMH